MGELYSVLIISQVHELYLNKAVILKDNGIELLRAKIEISL